MQLTGNPFVDTGLCVMAHLTGSGSVPEMSWSAARDLIGDGRDLAQKNLSLKSFTMVFGTNGPLTQFAYKKSGKNESIYAGTIARLVAAADHEGTKGDPCELTGIRTTFNFHEACAGALLEAGQKVPETKWVGRDWVPLAGSLGNDAQALPAASRPLHVSATALLALQYLPQSLFLFQGLLACTQSAAASLVQSLVGDMIENNRERIGEIQGKGEGTAYFVRLLMNRFNKLQKTIAEYSLPAETSLELWLFSNSGTGANCRIVPIPDNVLQFLWQAEKQLFTGDIEQLLNVEPRDPRFQFLTAIREGRDYQGLYPYSKWRGTSQSFYEFYQTTLVRRHPAALRTARKLAKTICAAVDKKTLEVLRKPEAFSSGVNRHRVRRIIADNQAITPAEYDALFPTIRHHPVSTDFAGWSLIRFYLNLPKIADLSLPEETMLRTTHPKIEFLAREYMTHKSPKQVKNVLDRLARGTIGVGWLREVFCRLAETSRGFNCEDWSEFVLDEEGRPAVKELLFQFRLELANLYRQSNEQQQGDHSV